jgi:hypothetical protein
MNWFTAHNLYELICKILKWNQESYQQLQYEYAIEERVIEDKQVGGREQTPERSFSSLYLSSNARTNSTSGL